MLDISRRLLYYKRPDIREAIAEGCRDREVGVRFGDSFGKRPESIHYPEELLDFVKRGATSFHLSEEHWSNPENLRPELSRHQLDELRSGWDLVLDIDCPNWQFAKLTTHLFIKALLAHDIKSISCKFSGNKGFHIGVPFAVFPDEIYNNQTKNWFPDGPKKIALYLLSYITNNYVSITEEGIINFDNYLKTTRQELAQITGKSEKDLSLLKCGKCGKKVENVVSKEKREFVCTKCGMQIIKLDDQKYLTCPKCNSLMEKFLSPESTCKKCGSKDRPIEIFDPLSIVNVDTILISSRHLFRSPFSLHEKSGLVSLPIPLDRIMIFEKEMAKQEKINPLNCPKFLDTTNAEKNEAGNLLIRAFDLGTENIPFKIMLEDEKYKNFQNNKFEDITSAIPKELFPPCILKMLEGLEDGRKRSMFVLTNFLTCVGWNYNKAEELLLDWNRKNKEPLKEGLIKSQLRYHKQRNKKVLPPNCRSYYQDFHVCMPDSLCERIKNPVQYSKRKTTYLSGKKGKREKLTDEQKELRRKYRENLKNRKT